MAKNRVSSPPKFKIYHINIAIATPRTKNSPRTKIFRKKLSQDRTLFFRVGQKFSENFYPRTKYFRKFLSQVKNFYPVGHLFGRTKILMTGSIHVCEMNCNRLRPTNTATQSKPKTLVGEPEDEITHGRNMDLLNAEWQKYKDKETTVSGIEKGMDTSFRAPCLRRMRRVCFVSF